MKLLQITDVQNTDLSITEKHFGSNIIAVDDLNGDKFETDQASNGTPKQTFMDAIHAIDVTDLRYPAGAPDAAFQDGLLINGALPEHLTNFMDAMAADGRQAVIVTPTFGSYTNQQDVQRFTELLLESYGPYVRAIEIGNEYWQQQGETAYGRIANETALAVASAEAATGISVDVWVQMANASGAATEFTEDTGLGWQPRVIEANKAIINQLSNEALAAIDGVVEHGYYRHDTQVIGSLEDTTTFIWLDVQTWREETGRDFDLAITEWNIKTTNENQHGLKSASNLLQHFEHLIELGADDLHFWSVQHNTKTDLAGSDQVLFDADTGVVNNSVGGSIFDLMSSNLVGKELIELGLSGDDTFINTHAYEGDNELVIFIASRAHEKVSIEFGLGDFFPTAQLQGATLVSYDTGLDSSDGIRFSQSAKGFIEADYLVVDGERHYINEHDARGAVDVLSVASGATSTGFQFDLKPYEVVQLVYSISPPEPTSGTQLDDQLALEDGDQFVQLFEGNDTVNAGQGADTIMAGSGDDHVIGGAGNDLIEGETGNDFLSGWGGNDTIRGGEGNDVIAGYQGSDTLEGGSENDTIRGDDGDDFLQGGSGFDSLEGGAGADVLAGGTQADNLFGGADNDTLEGGDGFDRLFGDDGDDLLDGGAGDDLLSGGSGNDLIEDLSGDNRAFGGGGFDTITGGAGDDEFHGENHADILTGGDGNDLLFGGDGFDMLYGGDGNDSLDGGFNNDRLVGGEGNDTLEGQAGFDFLEGEGGDDLLIGGNDADRMTGGFGNDVMLGGTGVDYLFGGNQNDTMEGGTGDDTVIGGNGEDQVSGDSGNDRLLGGSGNDTVLGGEGDDNIFGGAGFDFIEGGQGNDNLKGDFNADTFFFAEDHGHDIIIDFELGNANEKIDLSALAADGQTTDWEAAMLQIGTNVLITTGVDSSITVKNADIATIYEYHLIA